MTDDPTYPTYPTISRSQTFWLEGNRYRYGAGSEAVPLIADMLRAIDQGCSLLSFRPRIRQLRSKNCRAVLSHLAGVAAVQRMRLIAIWLRGQCGGYVGTKTLERFAFNRDERIRRATARALQNMSAWSVLDTMTKNDPSSRVRRLAAPRQRRDFSDRFSQFANSVEPIETSPKTQSLFVSPGVTVQNPMIAKSAEMIRKILEHIRSLVHSA